MNTSSTKKLTVALGALGLITGAQASTDWGPATWHAICNANWYTSGNGHHFAVIHDMEGYYASTIAWFDNCSMSSASVHYAVNGKKDTSTDYAAGDVTQLGVRESNYAWHACCWNTWMYGTEHEGFASNPAWYTSIMYANSANLQRHLCNVSSIPKDHNHVIGHNQWKNSAWKSWMSANYPSINTGCNTHSDPGSYWDWSKFMGYVSGSMAASQVTQSPADGSTETAGANFTYSVTVTNTGAVPWICLGGQNGFTLNYVSGTKMGYSNQDLGSDTVYPGEKHTFTCTLTAPSTAGTYTLYTRMNNTDLNYFGGTFSLSITVGSGGGLITKVVDNSDAGFNASANWTTGTADTDKYGSDYQFHSTVASSDTADWVASLANAGSYKVYAWWTEGSNRSTAAPYIVNHSGGSSTVTKNQTTAGGQWNLLGTYTLNAGDNTVSLSCWAATGDVVVADAIKWVQQ